MALALLIWLAFGVVTAQKTKPTISLLNFIPFSGLEPRDGLSCKAAAEIVIREVKKRNSEFLPNYNIEVDFEDEGANSLRVVKKAIVYQRSFETSKDTIQSPVTIGPYFTAGCQYYGQVVDYLNMVTIATGCQSPFFTAKRRRFPNTYRTRITGELIVHPWLQFIQNVGNWRSIAILTWAGNAFDYSIAQTFYSASLEAEIKIVWYNSPASIDDVTMQSLKDSDARIIVLPIGEANVVAGFFCQAYKFGIKGANFAFLGLTKAYTDPTAIEVDDVPSGCSKAILAEQTEITFWAGEMYSAAFNYGSTTLGYDLLKFEQMFDDYTSKLRTPDYDRRHQCHDSMLQAILTLDQSEKALQRLWNLSLEDYAKQPELVMKVVNETASKIDFHGLRIGHVHYSQRAELDDEPQCVAQWRDGNYDILYLVTRDSKSSIDNSSGYAITQLHAPLWSTPRGHPPKDVAQLLRPLLQAETPLLGFLVAAFIIILAFEVGAIVIQFLIKPREQYSATLRTSKCVLLVGCILLDFGAVIFVLPRDFWPARISFVRCYVRIVLHGLGITILTGYLLFRLVLSTRRMDRFTSGAFILSALSWRSHSGSSMRSRFSSGILGPKRVRAISMKPGTPAPKSQHPTAKRLEFFVIVNTVILLMPMTALLIAWGVANPQADILVDMVPTPVYDEASDSYSQPQIYVCGISLFWSILISMFNIPALALGCLISYKLRHETPGRIEIPELKQTRLAVLNCTTLLLAGILILGIARQATSTLPDLITAFTGLLLSATTSAIVVYPGLISLRKAMASTLPAVQQGVIGTRNN